MSVNNIINESRKVFMPKNSNCEQWCMMAVNIVSLSLINLSPNKNHWDIFYTNTIGRHYCIMLIYEYITYECQDTRLNGSQDSQIPYIFSYRVKSATAKRISSILWNFASWFSLHIRSMWETICDAWACWSGWNFGPNSTFYPYSVEYPPPPPKLKFKQILAL